MSPAPNDAERSEPAPAALAARGVLGGALMGLANLVPGISGGTMLLATGVYPQFVNGIAEVSTFRFRARSLLVLMCIIGAAFVAVLLGAGPISNLVVHKRWIMYSLFIGLTLGGVPVLWRMVRPADPTVIVMSIIGIVIMALLALVPEASGAPASAGGAGPYVLAFLAGLAGASAMVLPGVSGGYLLLLLGQYVVILTAVSNFKDALTARDVSAAMSTMHVIIPVGLGVLVGVVGVSNLIKVLLERFERATLGALLGLLLGAVIGLWPFQVGVEPDVGATFRGDRVIEVDGVRQLEQTGRLIEPADWKTEFFSPTPGQIAGAVMLIGLGFITSCGIALVGSRSGSTRRDDRAPGAGPDTTG